MAKPTAVAVAAILAISLSECGSPPPPTPPTQVEITFAAAPDVNPDASGRASPISVRYYQLAATPAFDAADYFQLHDKEAALLGPSLLERQETSIAPGVSQMVAFTAKPGTIAIGVAASYRDIDRAQWRAETPIAAAKVNKLTVKLDKLSAKIAADGS
jgi:type VI secretion system protein VasD